MTIGSDKFSLTRRGALASGGAFGLSLVLFPKLGLAQETQTEGDLKMTTFTTSDGTEIFYKDWGSGQPIVFSHGWPLSADAWDAQMLFWGQQELADMVRQETISRDTVDQRVTEKLQKMKKSADFAADRLIAFHATLTAEQREKVAEHIEEHASNRRWFCRY